MYADLNGDGKVDAGANTAGDHGDLSIIGNSTPRYHFGIDLTADYKGFDFRAFFQGVMKRDYFQNSSTFWAVSGGLPVTRPTWIISVTRTPLWCRPEKPM